MDHDDVVGWLLRTEGHRVPVGTLRAAGRIKCTASVCACIGNCQPHPRAVVLDGEHLVVLVQQGYVIGARTSLEWWAAA